MISLGELGEYIARNEYATPDAPYRQLVLRDQPVDGTQTYAKDFSRLVATVLKFELEKLGSRDTGLYWGKAFGKCH